MGSVREREREKERENWREIALERMLYGREKLAREEEEEEEAIWMGFE